MHACMYMFMYILCSTDESTSIQGSLREGWNSTMDASTVDALSSAVNVSLSCRLTCLEIYRYDNSQGAYKEKRAWNSLSSIHVAINSKRGRMNCECV